MTMEDMRSYEKTMHKKTNEKVLKNSTAQETAQKA